MLREGLVRVDGLPLVLQALGAQDLPRNTRVRVQFGEADLITLELPCKVVEVLTDAGAAAADTTPADEAPDEHDPATLATGLHLAVDDAEAAPEAGAEPSPAPPGDANPPA